MGHHGEEFKTRAQSSWKDMLGGLMDCLARSLLLCSQIRSAPGLGDSSPTTIWSGIKEWMLKAQVMESGLSTVTTRMTKTTKDLVLHANNINNLNDNLCMVCKNQTKLLKRTKELKKSISNARETKADSRANAPCYGSVGGSLWGPRWLKIRPSI